MPDLEENEAYWNRGFHWRYGGDEWSAWWGSPEVQWCATIYPRIEQFLPTGYLVEIAPGFGRWTEFLRNHCDRLIGIDLSKKCVKACRRRFKGDRRLTFHVNDGKHLKGVDDGTADFVFSCDSLVHVERDVMDSYVTEIARVLADDSIAFIHHSNMAAYAPETVGRKIPHWRSGSVSALTVAEAAEAVGLNAFRQELIGWGDDHQFLNDSFTWLTRAGSLYDAPREVVANENFMAEAREARERFSAAAH